MVISAKRAAFSCWKASLAAGVEKCWTFCLSWGQGGNGDACCCLTCQCWGQKGIPNEGKLAASWNLDTLPAFKNTNLSQCQKTLLPPRKGGSSKSSWNWLLTGLGFILTTWVSHYFKFKMASASYTAQLLALFGKDFGLLSCILGTAFTVWNLIFDLSFTLVQHL